MKLGNIQGSVVDNILNLNESVLRLRRRISAINTGLVGGTTVQDTTLTGYTVGSNTAVVNTDTLIEAIGKLQAEVNSLSARVTALEP